MWPHQNEQPSSETFLCLILNETVILSDQNKWGILYMGYSLQMQLHRVLVDSPLNPRFHANS
jgi:hypothetical protein